MAFCQSAFLPNQENFMLPTQIDATHTDSQSLLKNAKDMVRAATSATADKADALLAQGSGMLKSATGKAVELEKAAIQGGKSIAGSTDEYVRDNPWKAVGIAAGAAALVAAVVARR
jgi:ElaB/YqjD/DUF883 family membrane-anchored ribosome-binding protein